MYDVAVLLWFLYTKHLTLNVGYIIAIAIGNAILLSHKSGPYVLASTNILAIGPHLL